MGRTGGACGGSRSWVWGFVRRMDGVDGDSLLSTFLRFFGEGDGVVMSIVVGSL